MANQGISHLIPYFSGSLDMVDDDQLKKECIFLVQKDLSLLDAGGLHA